MHVQPTHLLWKLFKATHSNVPEAIVCAGVNWSLYRLGQWESSTQINDCTNLSLHHLWGKTAEPSTALTPILFNSKPSELGSSDLLFYLHQQYRHCNLYIYVADII